MVFIAGENNDVEGASSNMAGKSTLACGVPFALYGCDLSGTNIMPSCVTTGTPTCRVRVGFVRGKDRLHVTRMRLDGALPSGESRNRCDISGRIAGKGINFTGSAEDIQPHIDAMFGTQDLFLAAHCFGCDTSVAPFAEAGDRAQRQLFDLLIDSSDLIAALDRVRNEVMSTRALEQKLANSILLQRGTCRHYRCVPRHYQYRRIESRC